MWSVKCSTLEFCLWSYIVEKTLLCIYVLFLVHSEGDAPGLQPEDLEASIATLQSLAETIDAEYVELRRRTEQDGVVVEYLIRQRTDERDFMEVRYGRACQFGNASLLASSNANIKKTAVNFHESSIYMLCTQNLVNKFIALFPLQGGSRGKRRRRKEYTVGCTHSRGSRQWTWSRSAETLPSQTRTGVGPNEQRRQRHSRVRLSGKCGEQAGPREPRLDEDLRTVNKG